MSCICKGKKEQIDIDRAHWQMLKSMMKLRGDAAYLDSRGKNLEAFKTAKTFENLETELLTCYESKILTKKEFEQYQKAKTWPQMK